ncbi:uncharacterized protein LOC111699324 isoform X2 [Eurytemora carolleeae]|uniref:uncharacterized protein LOC111699324 isoform X2 n=1 Tax=Eurytemora carolleeae TaxID=1294199 RepID=UPI000C75E46E|nr:uncharacterized protein LOC111699324 isoform X2 [Eurytemora carolleeae]|eukprot:XP_023325735.1 uncharacterized protein LOC111699324 isoform X2 [Eurytemora affinis]
MLNLNSEQSIFFGLILLGHFILILGVLYMISRIWFEDKWNAFFHNIYIFISGEEDLDIYEECRDKQSKAVPNGESNYPFPVEIPPPYYENTSAGFTRTDNTPTDNGQSGILKWPSTLTLGLDSDFDENSLTPEFQSRSRRVSFSVQNHISQGDTLQVHQGGYAVRLASA